MKYTKKIEEAIYLSIQTHETNEKQKRKGKDIPYVTHPLAVGLILSLAGADEDLVAAGILHDVIEDSVEEKKVTRNMLEERFGEKVVQYVSDVSETNKELSWEERKEQAFHDVDTFSHESLMLKSADLISNNRELLDDYRKDGENTFKRFNAPKEKTLPHSIEMIDKVMSSWDGNPLYEDLAFIREGLSKLI